MKKLPWVLAAVAVVVLVAVFQLLDEPGAARGPDSTPTSSADPQAAPLLPTTRPPQVGTESAPVPLAASTAPPAPETGGPPAAYRKALGGLTGRVVEQDGTPVPDFALALAGGGLATLPLAFDQVLTGSVDLDPMLGSTTTDAEGRFRFEQLPPRIMGVLVLDPGGPRAGLHFLERTPTSAREHDLGDIVLPGGVTVIGRVVDERAAPLPGVRVRATDLPGMVVGSGVADYRQGGGFLVDTQDGNSGARAFNTPGAALDKLTYIPPASLAQLERMLPVPTTTTDADGRFVLPGVRQGVMTLVLDDGLHMTLVDSAGPTGAAGATRDVGTKVLPDGVPLDGQVVTQDGKPVPQAEVMAGNTMSVGPVTVLRPAVFADAEGRFHVPGLQPRTAYAVARAPQTSVFTPSEETVPGSPGLRIVLPTPGTLVLSVRDEQGVVVPALALYGRLLPDDGAEETPDFIIRPDPLDHLVSRDEEQHYIVTGLDAGLWELVLKAPGFAMKRELIELAGGRAESSLTLARGSGLPVRVLTADDGQPLEYAFVSAYEADEHDRPQSVARTGADGRATLADLLPGSYRVDAEYPGLAVAQGEITLPSETELVLSLGRGGRLSGSVVDGGRPPLLPLMVTINPQGDVPDSDEMPRFTLSALDGSFAFDDVPAGEVSVSVRERIDLGNLMAWWEPFAMSPMAEEEVFVTAGQESEVVLVVGSADADVASGTVSGRLSVNGHPAAGWKVRTWGEIRRSVATGPDGSFHMGRLAAGEVTLMISSTGGSMMGMEAVDTYTLQLAEGASEFVDISIDTGAVSGRVISERDGRPLEGAMVTLVSQDQQRGFWGGRRSNTATDADGRFAFEPVAAGNYVASVEAEGKGRSSSAPFKVSGLRTTDGVLVEVTEAVRVAGHLQLDAAARPTRWAWLTAESEDGNESASRPDVESLAFAFDDLTPGTWTFQLHGDSNIEFAPITLRIDHPADDLVLTFVAAEPDEGEVVVEESDEG